MSLKPRRGVVAACAALCTLLVVGCPSKDPTVDPAPQTGSSKAAHGSQSPAATAATAAKPPSSSLSFKDAKVALRKLYDGKPHETIYAGCVFESWRVDWSRCCLRAEGVRERMEWEHVVPASAFGRGFKEWTGGALVCVNKRGKAFRCRRCARRASKPFRQMEGDMHNLYPSVGVINQARSWFPMGLIEGEARPFGSCDIEVAGQRFEPRPAVRGDVARAHLYMNAVYRRFQLLDASAQALMSRWHRDDPPDAWERERNRYIRSVQGNGNPFIE